MFNRFFNESVLQRVLVRANEVRQTVSDQAARAREALGLPTALNPRHSAVSLARQLEREAVEIAGTADAHDLCVKWVAQILTSSPPSVDTLRYFDHAAPSLLPSPFAFLAAQSTEEEGAVQQLYPGDITAPSSWIAPPNAKPPLPATEPANGPGAGPETGPPEPGPRTPLATHRPSVERRSSRGSLVVMSIHSEIDDRLTFKEVLLRSQALELALISLARLEDVRSALLGGAEAASTRGALQRLLSLCLRGGSTKLHLELLGLLCSVDLRSEAAEVHLRHLAELTAILKLDWLDVHLAERAASIRAECKRIQERSLGGPPEGPPQGPSETPSTLLSEVAATRLPHLHLEARRIARRRLERRGVVEAATKARFDALAWSSEALIDKFAGLSAKAGADRGSAVIEFEAAIETHAAKSREAAEHAASVGSRRQALLQRSEKLRKKLIAAEAELTRLLGEKASVEEEVQSLQSAKMQLQKTFDRRVAVASELKRLSDLHEVHMRNMKLLVNEARELVEREVTACGAELRGAEVAVTELLPPSINAYLANEVRRLETAAGQVKTGLEALRTLKESRLGKENQLTELRRRYSAEEERAITGSEAPISDRPRSLEQLQGDAEEVVGSAERLRTAIADEQRRVLRAARQADSIWRDLGQFIDAAAEELGTAPAASGDGGSTVSDYYSDRDDEFVDVASFIDDDKKSKQEEECRLATTDDNQAQQRTAANERLLQRTFRKTLTQATAAHDQTKNAIAECASLLQDIPFLSIHNIE